MTKAKAVWEQELGGDFTEEGRKAACYKTNVSAISVLHLQFKVLHRLGFSKARQCKIYPEEGGRIQARYETCPTVLRAVACSLLSSFYLFLSIERSPSSAIIC